MRIKIKPFKQSKGYCGPASLKIALSAYKINKSENNLVKLTKTKRGRCNRKEGCTENEIVRAAKRLGLKAYIKQKSSITEIKKLTKKGIPVIVDWFSPETNSHFSVVAGFEKENILIVDPYFGKIIKHKIKWFENRWFTEPFSAKGPILRQIVVVYK